MLLALAGQQRGYAMHNRVIPAVLALGVASLSAACASNPAPAAKAAGVERTQCDSSTQDATQLLRSTKVLRIDPIYSHVLTTRNGSEERVNGAKLIVRAPPGVTADQMTRTLQCHSARVLLGQVNSAAVPNDPYWLPNAWVNIDVKPENGNFTVTLSADTVRDNLQVLSRANHYADDHMMATQPELP
jgi:hypothetical protein